MSPYEAVYGRKVTEVSPYIAGSSKVSSVDELLQHHATLLQDLKDNLHSAQQRMIKQANEHRSEVEYEVGDWVLVRLQPYRHHSVRNKRTTKLARRFYGPFRIEKRIGKVAYKVALPAEARIHDVFHIALQKKFKGNSEDGTMVWPKQFVEAHPLVQPAKVIGFRQRMRQGKPCPEYLIQWENQGVDDATWEPKAELQAEFPDFNLEVEETSHGGRNDTGRGLQLAQDEANPGEARRGSRRREISRRFPEDIYQLDTWTNRKKAGAKGEKEERIPI